MGLAVRTTPPGHRPSLAGSPHPPLASVRGCARSPSSASPAASLEKPPHLHNLLKEVVRARQRVAGGALHGGVPPSRDSHGRARRGRRGRQRGYIFYLCGQIHYFFLDNGYIKNIRPLAKSTTCVAKSIGCVVRFVTGTMRAMRDRWLEVAHVG